MALAERNGDTDAWSGHVDRCMSHYDLSGWTAAPWAEESPDE